MKKVKRYAEMSSEEQKAKREEWRSRNEAAEDKLLAGMVDLIQSQRWSEYLNFQARFYRYSFGNTLLILFQKPTATMVGSFKFWKSLGRYPRKGTGLAIFVPFKPKKTREVAAEETVPADGDAPAEDTSTKKDSGGMKFGIGHVFDVSDTDGKELPAPIVTLLSGDDQGLYERLKDYAREVLGVTVDEVPSLGGANGICVHGEDGKAIKIGILASLPPAHKAKTLAHELGHAHLHTANEYRGHSLRSRMELEAESVAYIVLNHFGLDAGEYSFGYLATWSGGGDPDAIKVMRESGYKLQGTAKKIIYWLEGIKLEDEQDDESDEGPVSQPIAVDLGSEIPIFADA